MKNLFFLLTIIFAISLISCDKDKDKTIFEGRVLEFGTLDPVVGAAVVFEQGYSTGIGQGYNQWPIDTIYTDANGEYRWETKINPRNDQYNTGGSFTRNVISKEFYWPYTNKGNNFKYLDKEKEEIILDPIGYVNITATNVEEIEGDYLFFSFVNDNGNFEISFNNNFIKSYPIYANRIVKYGFRFEDEIPKYDSIYISALDTVKIHLNY